jgi:hypothetical protein
LTVTTCSNGWALAYLSITFMTMSRILSTIIRGLESRLSLGPIKRKYPRRVVELSGGSIWLVERHTALRFRMALCGHSFFISVVTTDGGSTLVKATFSQRSHGGMLVGGLITHEISLLATSLLDGYIPTTTRPRRVFSIGWNQYVGRGKGKQRHVCSL